MAKKILITGGAVHVHLDSVKIITNRFKGGTIAQLAATLADDFSIIYLTSRYSKRPADSRIEIIYHEGFNDYMEKVKTLSKVCDGVILGAAVANLIPVNPWKNKFPSHDYKEGEIIPINFTVAPRVINMVKKEAPKTTLIGFKLLQGVKHEELVDAAYEVLVDSGSSFVIANDADDLIQKYIVTKEKSVIPLKGDYYFDFLKKSLKAEYYRTELLDEEAPRVEISWVHHLAEKWKDLLKTGFDKKRGLMFGSISMRRDEGFITTSRKKYQFTDMTIVKKVDHDRRIVYAYGKRKPSLNSPLIDNIFKDNPKVCAVVHYHKQDKILNTEVYEPPGTVADSFRTTNRSFNIAHHGAFILLDKCGGDNLVNEYNLTYDEYNSVYARFLNKSPRELFELVGEDLQGKKVLDLCAGTLRASKVARKMGAAQVTAVDESTAAFPIDFSFFIDVKKMDVETYLSFYSQSFDPSFDVVICQQAINYWFNETLIEYLPRVMADKGCFIFNTFNTKPPSVPTLKETVPNTWECFYCDAKDIIHHVQMVKGQNPHLTSFQWIPPFTFEYVLEKNFNLVKKHTSGKTDIYICYK